MLERLLADVTPEVGRLLDAALSGRELSRSDALRLLVAEGADFQALLRAADVARRDDNGDDVSFVINRNINFTNVCYVGCSFCGFSRHADDPDAYDRTMEEILGKCRDAVARGASEVCIQGGIDPKKDHRHYRLILETIKAEFPSLHIHAYSPEEIDFGQKKSGMPLREYLLWLKEAGLGTIPGTAAAASGVLTVMRTSSEPASASSRTCCAVAAAFSVSVLAIDWTTTGAPAPTRMPPTRTPTVCRRAMPCMSTLRKKRIPAAGNDGKR